MNQLSGKMVHQTKTWKNSNSEWFRKVESAISIIDQKICIVNVRLNAIRDLNVAAILKAVGGPAGIVDKRLAIIKCLLSIIENHGDFSGLTTEEASVIDVCRSISESSGTPKFVGFSYDIIRNSIVAPDGTDVARILSSGVVAEETGYLMSRSWDMAEFLEKIVPFSRSVNDTIRCTNDDYCLHCRAGEIFGQGADLLSEVK